MMMAGHFGLAAAVKAKSPNIPLWALLVSTQLLDIVFLPLFIAGIESMQPVAGNGYGGYLFQAYYSHSLLGALLIALLTGLAANRFWGRRGGVILSSVVFSHWILDLLVHRADLPILPGNLGDLPLLGLGLWNFTMASILIESTLIIVGAILYFRTILATARAGQKAMTMTVLKGVTMGVFMAFLLFVDVI